MESPAGPLPERLRRYFWEYDASKLTLDGSRHTIFLKLLESGGWDATRWMRATFGDDEIRAFLTRRHGRGIDPRRLRFWGLVLHLPREQVTGWIEAQRSNPWAHRRGT